MGGENIIVLLDYILIFLCFSLYPIGLVFSIIELKGIKLRHKKIKYKKKNEKKKEILIKRYLYDEITKEQYEQIKKDLEWS